MTDGRVWWMPIYIYVYIHMCVNAPEWCQPAMNLLLEPARGPPAPKKGRPPAEKTRAHTLCGQRSAHSGPRHRAERRTSVYISTFQLGSCVSLVGRVSESRKLYESRSPRRLCLRRRGARRDAAARGVTAVPLAPPPRDRLLRLGLTKLTRLGATRTGCCVLVHARDK